MDHGNAEQGAGAGAEPVSDRIRAAVRGDGAALDWLVEWLSPLMLSWARAQVRPGIRWPVTPEDLVQDVWVRVLPELGRLEPHQGAAGRMTPALVGVVKRVLRNRVIDVRRAAIRRQVQGMPAGERPDDFVPTPSSGPVSKALRGERSLLLQAALDRLTARERALYVKRVFEDAGIDELADEFGMSRDAVIKARQRVRHKLAAILGPQLLDELET